MDENPLSNAIWLSWHRSGRTLDLSRRLGTRTVAWQLEAPWLVRHPASALWSVYWLCRLRPRRVVLQHSFLLAVIVAAYKRWAPWTVVVVDDCHTKALRRRATGFLAPLFRGLRRWSMSSFDGLLVATPTIASEATELGVPLFVLPDPVPDLQTTVPCRSPLDVPVLEDAPTVVVVGSFAEDEPVTQILDAARDEPGVGFVMTGRPPAWLAGRAVPDNVRLVGFLDWPCYVAVLGSADAIVVLTTHPGTILRGACEALAMAKPLVTSDTAALRDYVGEAAILVRPDAADILRGIASALERREQLVAATRVRRDELAGLHRQTLRNVRCLLAGEAAEAA